TLREFYALMRGCGYTPFTRLGLLAGGLVTLAPWLEARWHVPTQPLLALATVVFSVRLLGERTPETRVDSLASTLFGLIYVAGMLQYYVRLVVPLPGDTVPPTGRLVLCLWVI